MIVFLENAALERRCESSKRKERFNTEDTERRAQRAQRRRKRFNTGNKQRAKKERDLTQRHREMGDTA